MVLACGGFPHDVARRKALFPHAPTGAEHYSPGPTGNTGDGLRLAEAVGGKVDTTLPHAAAWVPVSVTTRKDGTKGVMPHFIDRAKPGVIAVTANGKRFTNEGNSYHDFVQAMVAACAGRARGFGLPDLRPPHAAQIRSWLRGAVPAADRPSSPHRLSDSAAQRFASSPRRRASMPAGLEATVREFNIHARDGKDPAFGKGSKAYNRYPGRCAAFAESLHCSAGKGTLLRDQARGRRSRNLCGSDHRPTFARPGRRPQSPIPGLYAVGNDIASIMGGNYPGAGITLGPALTFGHIAGCHIAGVQTGVEAELTPTRSRPRAAARPSRTTGPIVMGEVA